MTKKFLFLSVNSSYSHSSLALPILHNAAENYGNWTWDSIECTVAEDFSEVAAKAVKYQPDLVGASLYIFNRTAVLDILSRIHRLLPSARIVLGGPECSGTSGNELLEKYDFIHGVFVGEAEELFARYLADFDTISLRKRYPENGTAQYDKWQEKFPVNDRFFRTDKAFVQVETSRGCPIGCKYCTSSHIPLRFKELDEVEKELSALHAQGVKEVRLLDRTFNFPQWRGAALLKLFREKFSDIEFHLEIHPHFLNDELKNELRIAPSLHIEAGVQSFDENVQKAIGRNCSVQSAIQGIKFLASCSNFETHVDLICGLPKQTMTSVLNDAALLINLQVDEIQLETLKVLHGTPLREEADRTGIIYSSQIPYDVMQTPDMSCDEILYLRKVSRITDIFHNHSALRAIVRKLAISDGKALRKFTDFMLERAIMLNGTYDLKKRLLFLVEYVKNYPAPEGAFEICKAWIANNYPINALPFGTVSKFDGTVPPKLFAENSDLLNHRETKLWRLNCEGFTLYFAMNRHFKLNGAALSWL